LKGWKFAKIILNALISLFINKIVIFDLFDKNKLFLKNVVKFSEHVAKKLRLKISNYREIGKKTVEYLQTPDDVILLIISFLSLTYGGGGTRNKFASGYRHSNRSFYEFLVSVRNFRQYACTVLVGLSSNRYNFINLFQQTFVFIVSFVITFTYCFVVKESRDPSTNVVLLEDSAAVLGVMTAGAALGLTQLTGTFCNFTIDLKM